MSNKPMVLAGAAVCAVAVSFSVYAKQPDYSGVYDCKGKDAAEGDYSAVVTLTLNKAQSAEGYGAYDFKMEVPGFGSYPGEAVAKGDRLAIYFGLDQPGSQDHGTGLATVKKTPRGNGPFASSITSVNTRAATTASKAA